jgi:hypothetical protein
MCSCDVGNMMPKYLLLLYLNAEGNSYYFYDTLGRVWSQNEESSRSAESQVCVLCLWISDRFEIKSGTKNTQIVL